MKRNLKKRGEVMLAILIGLAVGCVVTWVSASKKAQDLANESGREVAVGDVIVDNPGESLAYPMIGAAAGWGVSKLLAGGDNSKSSSQDNAVRISADGNVNVTISGNSSSRTDNRNDTRADDSYNVAR